MYTARISSSSPSRRDEIAMLAATPESQRRSRKLSSRDNSNNLALAELKETLGERESQVILE